MQPSHSPRPASPESAPGVPSGGEIISQLKRIQTSREFAGAQRVRAFLEFVVLAALRSAEPLKETSIGVELLGRPVDYDPKADSIVRTQARRVRERLDGYYRGEGREDRVLIQIPKGGYLPVFSYRLAESVEVTAAEEGESGDGGLRFREWRLVAVLGMAGVVALAGWLALVANEKRVEKEVQIVVLPFLPAEPRPGDELYGQAIANAVVASLTRRDHYRVTVAPRPRGDVGRDTAYRQQLVAHAGSDYLVSGHLDRRTPRSTITAKLVRLADGGVVWSRRYVLDWRDLVKVEEDLGETIAAKLAEHLGQREDRQPKRVPARSMEANREFLNGYYAAAITRQTVRFVNFDRARGHLERALELSPEYPDAHAVLALLMSFRLVPWRPGNEEYLERAESHAKRALVEVPGHPEALAALVRCKIVRRDLKAAMAYAKRAVQSEPGNTDAINALADVYHAMGFYEAALQMYKRSVSEVFVAMEPYVYGSLTAARIGRWEEAQGILAAYAEYDAESVIPTTLRGIVLTSSGRPAEGEAIHRRTAQLIDRSSAVIGSRQEGEFDFVYLALALALVRQGRNAEAEEMVSKVAGTTSRRAEDELLVHALLGHRKQTMLALRQSCDFRNYRFLVTRPEFKFLYTDPEFREMVGEAYGAWQSWLIDYGGDLPEQPPALPPPAEALGRVTK